MPNILSAADGAKVLRCATDDPLMLVLLAGVDAYIEMATGRAWQNDATIREEAKNAARILLVRMHEDPGALGMPTASLSWGLSACLAQLEGLALTLETAGVPDEAFAVRASMPADGATEIAVGIHPVIVFNHVVDDEDDVVLLDASGAVVTCTKAVDASGKIVTLTPSTDLNPGASYTIDLDGVADTFGQVLDETANIEFETGNH